MSCIKPTCTIPGGIKTRTFLRTVNPYCEMHKARLRRSGHFGLRDKRTHKLEKLPHAADMFILEHAHRMLDRQIAEDLRNQGMTGATTWTVRYRRRKRGVRKYATGDQKKYTGWIRRQALRKPGVLCELCGYHLFIETHHIIPRYRGGPHEVDNLMVVCSNCHVLLTRGYIQLFSRAGIPRLREFVRVLLRTAYPNLG